MAVEVRRAEDRFVTRRPGSTSWHGFSFGPHYDPGNVAFGPVVAVNDEHLEGGRGFDDHAHADLVIVTYVVSGSLLHQGISTHTLQAGQTGIFCTGRSSVHAEHAGQGPVRFVQTWLTGSPLEPSYTVGSGTSALPHGAFHVCRLEASEALPQAPLVHAFVLSGELRVADAVAGGDDALRLTDVPDPVVASTASEVLVWTSTR